MKEFYFGEFKRSDDGTFLVDDSKVDREKMTEVQMSIYLGSLIGAAVEKMNLAKATGSIFIRLTCDDKVWEEVRND